LDQFADLDLQYQAQVRRVPDYPQELIPILKSLPKLPLVYIGGLENRADVLAIAQVRHHLWGNDAATVRRVRDPHQLQDVARLARVGIPEVRFESDPPPADGTWLLRPRLREQGDVRFVGVTRQLVGESACHAIGFQWCGNIGPIALPVDVENLIRRLGNVLKWKVGLVGLFGVDLILDRQNTPWITEVNPRYPASLELLEHATGLPLFGDHARCFDTGVVPESRWGLPHPGEFLGKAVLYSPADFVLAEELADAKTVSADAFPTIADLPAPGESFRRGDPICTLFAESPTPEGTWTILQTELAELTARLPKCAG
jgi:hypothetical protein